MKRTPNSVSRARQKLRTEMEVWKAGIAAARREMCLDGAVRAMADQKVSFGEAQLKRCKKEIAKLGRKGKPRFWPENTK